MFRSVYQHTETLSICPIHVCGVSFSNLTISKRLINHCGTAWDRYQCSMTPGCAYLDEPLPTNVNIGTVRTGLSVTGHEGRKEMFYLTTHQHILVTVIWRQTYGKHHSDSVRGNPLSPHGLLFSINSKGSFTDRITHTTAFVTPVVEHWLERDIAQWVHPMKDRSDDPVTGHVSCVMWSGVARGEEHTPLKERDVALW